MRGGPKIAEPQSLPGVPCHFPKTADQSTSRKDETKEMSAARFLEPTYRPSDDSTVELCELIGVELGMLPASPAKAKKIALLTASFLASLMALDRSGGNRLIWPHDDKHWSQYPAVGKDVVNAFRSVLVEQGWLTLWEPAEFRKHSTTYRVREDLLSFGGEVRETDAPLIQIRADKPKSWWSSTSVDVVGKRKAKATFGERPEQEAGRIEALKQIWKDHPLTLADGRQFSSATRIFNSGRMDCGGRLYGGWQTEKETERVKATIDGEPVAEIDLRACNLILLTGLTGCTIPANRFDDPYALLPSVAADPGKRDVVKQMALEIFGSGNPRKRRSRNADGEFPISVEEHQALQEELIECFPALEKLPERGWNSNDLAFHESEIVLNTIEQLHARGITAYPMHDAIIAKANEAEEAAQELRQRFSNYVWEASGMTLWPSVSIEGDGGISETISGCLKKRVLYH